MKMPDLSDLSKLTEKLDLQNVVKNVKSMISPGSNIPETSKDDPIGYRLFEITKALQTLGNLHEKQSVELAKLNNTLGALYQEYTATRDTQQKICATATAAPIAATTSAAPAESVSEKKE